MFTFHIGLSPFLFELLKITVEKSTLIFNTYFAEKISVAVPTVIFHFGKYVSLERQLFSAKKYVLKKQQLFLLGWKQKKPFHRKRSETAFERFKYAETSCVPLYVSEYSTAFFAMSIKICTFSQNTLYHYVL